MSGLPVSVRKCGKCGANNPVHRPFGLTVFACPSCKSITLTDNSTLNKTNINTKGKFSPLIPLQSKGLIKGVAYTVIGAAQKREKYNSRAVWEEYVLSDETGQCAFLSQSGGHWIFLKQREKPAEYNPNSDFFENDDGQNYTFYTSYYSLTKNFIGEFPYDVTEVDKTFTREYIMPPFMFSAEEHDSELTCFAGEYMTPRQVRRSFSNSELTLPTREGIGSCQPFYFGIQPQRFAWLSFLFFIITLPLFLAMSKKVSNLALASAKLATFDSLYQSHNVSPSFEIADGPALLRIDSYSPVNNEWAEAEINIVNELTGKERSLGAGVEYYSGYDEDGGWSEGSVAGSVYVNAVEPGRYHIESKLSTSAVRPLYFEFNVYHDDPTGWNYCLVLLVLGGVCALILFAGYHFEKKRNES